MKSAALAVLATALGRQVRHAAVLRPSPPNLALAEEVRPPAPGALPHATPQQRAAPVAVAARVAGVPASARSAVQPQAALPQAKPRQRSRANGPAKSPSAATIAAPVRRLVQSAAPLAADAQPAPAHRHSAKGLVAAPVVSPSNVALAAVPPSRPAAIAGEQRRSPVAQSAPAGPIRPVPEMTSDQRASTLQAAAPRPASASAPITEPPPIAVHAKLDPVLTPLPTQPADRAAGVQPPRAALALAVPEIRIGTIEIHTLPTASPAPPPRAVPSRPGPAMPQGQRLARGYGWLGRS